MPPFDTLGSLNKLCKRIYRHKYSGMERCQAEGVSECWRRRAKALAPFPTFPTGRLTTGLLADTVSSEVAERELVFHNSF